MKLFTKVKTAELPLAHFERLYQYADGSFMPDFSQPDPDNNYEITASDHTPHTSPRYFNVKIGRNGKAQMCGKDCERDLPELYSKREDCCGCTACYAVCPVQAIVMRPCEEGFLYPVVDADKCVRCFKCISVCPVKVSDEGRM